MAVKRLIVAPLVALLAWPTPARADEPERRLVITGSVVLGVGAAAFVAAIPLHIRYRQARRAWSEQIDLVNPGPTGFPEGSWADAQAARTRSRRASIAMTVAYAVAIAGITAGATLLSVGLVRREAAKRSFDARISVSPWGGVSVGGRF